MASSVQGPSAFTPAVLPSVLSFLKRKPSLFIDGKWQLAESDRKIRVENPSDGSLLAEVPAGSEVDIDNAVKAARKAFDAGPWARITASDRGKLLWRLADLIDAHADELAQLITLENGKPYRQARYGELVGSSDMFRYMAGWTTKIDGATLSVGAPDAFHAYTRLEPIGVVGQIIPWNTPVGMAAWKLAPALATGCTVVLKLAEQTPLSGLRLAELVAEAGFPDGVVNVVTGIGEVAGAALVAHPAVDKVAFTGSTEVGRLIVHAASGNLKKVSLELGGKSPNIVFRDADLDAAVPGASDAIFVNSGQNCSAGSRLYVHSSIFDEFMARIAEHARKIAVGPGLSEDSEMGPLVSSEQLERVTGYMSEGTSDGALVAVGGRRLDRPGFFVEPTIFTQVRDDMRLSREEIFGPVVTAAPFNEVDEVIERANNSPYGLAAGVWTRDLSTAHYVAAKLKAGTVWVNNYGAGGAPVPFGGFKQSGWGRERGREVLHLYTETKAVVVRL